MQNHHTAEQKEIVLAPQDRHIKIVAGPGSGKSHTMLYRVERLINSGVKPNRILVAMFNEPAAKGFTRKIKSLLSKQDTPDMPRVSTYHSFGLKLCKSLGNKGLLPKFRFNPESSELTQLARQALGSCVNASTVTKCNPKSNLIIEDFVSFIDLVKSTIQTSDTVFTDAKLAKHLLPFIEAFNAFETLRKKKRVRFFSDLIYDPVMLLLESLEARSFIENHLDHIIVDEYQDINEISQQLIKIIAGSRAYVTVVGDDDQTIYTFRGSDPNYLISIFDKDFPNALYYKLTRTFRYGHSIALAANNLIHQNEGRLEKICLSDSKNPASIIEIHPEIESTEGDIADSTFLRPVKAWKEAGRGFNEIAILLRLFSSSPPIELALIKAGIPYKMDGGNPLFESNEIASLITLLEISTGRFFNPGNSRESIIKRLKQVFHMPRVFVKNDIIDRLIVDIVNNPDDIVDIADRHTAPLHQSFQSQLDRKAQGIKEIQEDAAGTPYERLDNYLEYIGCFTQIKKNARTKKEKLEAEKQMRLITAFLSYCKSFDNTDALLSEIAKHKSQKVSSNEAILITSAHRSKGLEFPMVIMPNLSEGVFPCINDDEGEENVDIEAERRLFFVGITRAVEKLILLVPYDDELFDNIKARKSNVPFDVPGNEGRASRFLYEANLRPSVEVATALYLGESYSNLPITDNKALINKYLVGAGSQIRF